MNLYLDNYKLHSNYGIGLPELKVDSGVIFIDFYIRMRMLEFFNVVGLQAVGISCRNLV